MWSRLGTEPGWLAAELVERALEGTIHVLQDEVRGLPLLLGRQGRIVGQWSQQVVDLVCDHARGRTEVGQRLELQVLRSKRVVFLLFLSQTLMQCEAFVDESSVGSAA